MTVTKKLKSESQLFRESAARAFDDVLSNAVQRNLSLAISVPVKDLHAWPNPQYPHKIAFRTCKVLYECDNFGKRI